MIKVTQLTKKFKTHGGEFTAVDNMKPENPSVLGIITASLLVLGSYLFSKIQI